MKPAAHVEWIGTRPNALQITMIMFVGIIGILIPGVQPIVLAALLAEKHIDLAQMGHAASVELLTMGLAASLAAALIPPRHLKVISLVTALIMAAANWVTASASGETVTLLRAVTGATGGILIWVTSCMIARSSSPDRWAGIYLTVQTLTQFLIAEAMGDWRSRGGAHRASSACWPRPASRRRQPRCCCPTPLHHCPNPSTRPAAAFHRRWGSSGCRSTFSS